MSFANVNKVAMDGDKVISWTTQACLPVRLRSGREFLLVFPEGLTKDELQEMADQLAAAIAGIL